MNTSIVKQSAWPTLSSRGRVITFAVYIVLLFVVGMLWQWAGDRYRIVALLVSTPRSVANYFAEQHDILLEATYVTTLESITGLAVATIIGALLIIICLYFPRVFSALEPLIVVSQVIPLVSLAPFFIILLGLGMISKIAMAALICVFPIFVNVAQGIRMVPQAAAALFDLHGASRTSAIFRLYLPMSAPYAFGGFKIAATLSVIGAIVAEFNGADLGLGKNIFIASRKLAPELMVCSIFLASALGILLFGTAKLAEVTLIRWTPDNENI